MATTRLYRTNGTPTNNSKWTFSCWLKRTKLSYGDAFILDGYVSGNDRFKFAFQSANKLEIWNSNGGSDDTKLDVNAREFKDTHGYYHFVLSMDATLTTAADRFKIYINGIRETNFGSNINPPQDSTEFVINQNGATVSIGDYYGGSNGFDGIMSHVHFIDGTAYDADTFGETDTTSGEWKIKTSPSVTYGNNGYFILKDGNNLSGSTVSDQSGNSNDFTVSGTLSNTQDCPSNIFNTININHADYDVSTIAAGATSVYRSGSGPWKSVYGNIGMHNGYGKYYMEFYYDTGSEVNFGISDFKKAGNIEKTERGNDTWAGAYANSYGYQNNGALISNGTTTGSWGSTYTTGDYMGMAVDMENLKIYFHKNGVYQASGDPSNGTGGVTINAPVIAYMPTMAVSNAEIAGNFGNGAFGSTQLTGTTYQGAGNLGVFKYQVPTGYTALCTKGLNE